ncbi:MAG TPA: FN3 domain-containing metallophosphoesterase family protein, partial [Clostridiales bacterium]|nr:FN3 domain-containing metallophosphoesterase family protein [Clostridiales bacterium]
MKKRLRISVSVVLVFVMLTATMAGSASALFGYNMSPEQWDTHWQEYSSDGSALYLAPGSDSSEMNFSWLGTSEDNNPAVYVRPFLSFGEYSEFTGVCVKLNDSLFSYKVTVTGLQPNTTYLYYYVSNAEESEVNTFQTARADSFSAIYVSDIHISFSEENPDNLKNTSFELNKVFAQAYEKNTDVSIILSAGDQADHGLLCEYSGVFSSPVIRNIPMATTCGNHDYKETVYASVTNNPNRYNGKQPLAADRNGGDYYFVKGDVLFLYINSNWTSANDHYDFVKQAVEANPDVKWRVVVMHHDLYGGHLENRESENRLLRLMFVPIFDEFGIDVVFMGHSHVFSRSHVMYGGNIATDITGNNYVTDANGTIYITTG